MGSRSSGRGDWANSNRIPVGLPEPGLTHNMSKCAYSSLYKEVAQMFPLKGEEVVIKYYSLAYRELKIKCSPKLKPAHCPVTHKTIIQRKCLCFAYQLGRPSDISDGFMILNVILTIYHETTLSLKGRIVSKITLGYFQKKKLHRKQRDVFILRCEFRPQ